MTEEEPVSVPDELRAQEIRRTLEVALSPEDKREWQQACAERRRYVAVCRDGKWRIRDYMDFTALPSRDLLPPSGLDDQRGAEELANWMNGKQEARHRGQHLELHKDLLLRLGEDINLRDAILFFENGQGFGVYDVKNKTPFIEPMTEAI